MIRSRGELTTHFVVFSACLWTWRRPSGGRESGGARRGDEPVEHGLEARVGAGLLLELPLHREDRATGELDRLDQAVGCERHGREAVAEAVDRLVVVGVD